MTIPDSPPVLSAHRLRQSTGHTYSRILSVGAARGEQLVPNDELVGPIDSSDEWIRRRTGIVTRARAGADVRVVDLAETAAREAIERARIAPDRIGIVLVSTITNDVATPSVAALLAHRIGATPAAAAFDIGAACAGYAYGIAQADSFVKSGLAEYVLVVGAEKLSEIVHPADRSISFLLADGAGAAVVGPSDVPGIGPTVWGSDGSNWNTIGMTSTYQDWRDGGEPPTIRQDGQSVFRWAVWDMAKIAQQALDAAGVTADQLAAFIPHQANVRIIDQLAVKLGLPEHVAIARDIETTGNTSAASIPLATHRLLAEHPEIHGQFALQIGFGAGLVYGAQVVVLPDRAPGALTGHALP